MTTATQPVQHQNGAESPKPVHQQQTALTTIPMQTGLSTSDGFALMQRIAQAFAASTLVPDQYRGQAGVANCIVALEMANRMGASPLMVMQNLYLVHGRPSWSATFMIASINATRRFTPLKFRMNGTKGHDDRGCVAYATELNSGELLESTEIDVKMAKDEGWFGKAGSKWKTMPEQMLKYRAATFFCRLYCPEVLMGLRTADEVEDIGNETVSHSYGAAMATQSKSDRLLAELRGISQAVPDVTQPAADDVGETSEATQQTATAAETPKQEPVKPEPAPTTPPKSGYRQHDTDIGRATSAAMLDAVRKSINTDDSLITDEVAVLLEKCDEKAEFIKTVAQNKGGKK